VVWGPFVSASSSRLTLARPALAASLAGCRARAVLKSAAASSGYRLANLRFAPAICLSASPSDQPPTCVGNLSPALPSNSLPTLIDRQTLRLAFRSTSNLRWRPTLRPAFQPTFDLRLRPTFRPSLCIDLRLAPLADPPACLPTNLWLAPSTNLPDRPSG